MLLGLATSPALAQDTTHTPWTRQVIESTKLGESRTIYVATPASYAGRAQRYPVLVLLDANDQPQFSAAVANIAFLANRGTIPELIVVGIGNGKDRTHDLTPIARGSTAKNFPTSGGAGPFVSFITDEVLPLVRSAYRTVPSTIFAGHSFGGLVALHVAAANPGAFNGVVAMSPSLWWNDSTAAMAYADSIAKTTSAVRLFATSGGLEAVIDVPTRRFIARLDSTRKPNVTLGHRHYPDDTHGLTPVPSLMDGLRFIFEPVWLTRTPVAALNNKADSTAVVTAFLATQRQYARGAQELGLPETLPETFTNQVAYQVLTGLKLHGAAIWLFRQNVASYPDSPNVYDSLGDGLLAAGDRAGARAQFQRALDVGARTGQPVAEETRKKLAALGK